MLSGHLDLRELYLPDEGCELPNYTHEEKPMRDSITVFKQIIQTLNLRLTRSISFSLLAIFLLSASVLATYYRVMPTGEATASTSIVISQVYGAGGNSGATLSNDYVELFNLSSSPQSLNGLSLQYGSSSGNFASSGPNLFVLPNVTLQPGQYFLFAGNSGGANGSPIPTPDGSQSGFSMSGSAGKVALVNSTSALNCGGATVCSSSQLALIVDAVAYGSQTGSFTGEGGTQTPGLSATSAAFRASNGCTDTDSNSADFSTGTPNPRNTASTFNSCSGSPTPTPTPSPSPTPTPTPVVLTPIHDIQGSGSSSPVVGNSVTTTGIVTGLKSNGFFIQEPDANVDANPLTSEGIFVFTSSAPTAAAAIGNLVQVTATVVEFIPSSDPFQPPLTELSSPTVVQLSTGNALPAPIVLTTADTGTGGLNSGNIENLEKYEGMRVQVNSLTVVHATEGSVSEVNATSNSNGVFYGVITGVARPFREAGIAANDPVPAGSGVTIPPVPRFDGNPERIRVDSDAQPGAAAINVGTGQVVSNLVGPLDYAFRTYTILPDPASPPMVSGTIGAVPLPAPAANEFTVASYNLERFFDTVNDPGIGEPVLTATAFNNRLNKASLAIRNILRTPDILGVIEVENLTTLQSLATKINSDAVNNSEPNPNYVAYLVEGNDVGGIDVGFLVKTAFVTGSIPRVTVNAVVQEGAGALFTNPDNSTELLNDRPPLRLMAVVNRAVGPGFPITVIVNHLRSLNDVNNDGAGQNGWPTTGARVRAKRQAQAVFLANLIQTRQVNDPTERILAVGDFNAFQVNDGLADVINTIKGTPSPDNQTAVAGDGADLVNPDLTNLVDLATAAEKYSYVFDGNAQVLDHHLANAVLFSSVASFRTGRIDADFPETFRNDANRPERLSDHDAPMTYIALPPCPTIGVTPANIPAGTAGAAYGPVQFMQSGGSGSISWSVSSNNLPSGLTLNPMTGALSGMVNFPIALNITVRATDSNNCFGEVTVALQINCQTINVTAPGINSGVVGQAFSQTFMQSGGIGLTTFSTVSALPNGINLSPAGVLGGTPTQSGVFPITVKATDSNNCMGTVSYTLTIASTPPPVTAKIADPLVCTGPGNTVSVTATVTNNSASSQSSNFTASLQPSLKALPGTCTANVGSCNVVNASTVNWSGTLAAGQTVTINYLAQVNDGVPVGAQVCVTSTATVGDSVPASVTACGTVNCPAIGPGALPQTNSPVSDQKAGSVLIYNVYTSSATGGNTQNTRIAITNTNTQLIAYVHLFFVADGCSVADSYLCLTPNQTASFLTSDLDPGTSGYIVAVATDSTGCPINFNFLIGDEYVKFTSGHEANLAAEAISAIAGGLPRCDTNSVTAQISFDGVSYNLVPRTLAVSNVGSRADGNDTLLILNRIGGNLGTGASSLGSIFGLLYDDAENALSFSFTGGCQLRSSISNNFPRTAPRFEQFVPAGRSGWIRLFSQSDIGMTGSMINFNANSAASAGAFNQGHNLHVLTNTASASYIIPVFPPNC